MALRPFLFAGGVLLVIICLILVSRLRTDPDVLWQAAQQELQAGRIDEARRLSQRLGRLRAPTDRDQILLAQVAIAEDRIDEALGFLGQLPEASPLLPQARLLAGQLELRRFRFRSAEGSLLQALELEPSLVQAYRELIYIYGYRSDTDAIEEQFSKLSEFEPVSAEEAFLWSLIRGVQWTPEEIVETLSRVIAADPHDRESRIALADALMELTRFEEAEAVLAPLDPSDPESKAALGRLALEQGDVPVLRILLQDAPEDHPAIGLLRGKLALQLRDPGSAVDHYRRVLDLRPNDREALSGLAQAMNQSGRRQEASEVIERLNQVNELNNLLNRLPTLDQQRRTQAYLELGEVCEGIGFLPQARAWYQNALGRDPFNREAQEALARISQVEAAGPIPQIED